MRALAPIAVWGFLVALAAGAPGWAADAPGADRKPTTAGQAATSATQDADGAARADHAGPGGAAGGAASGAAAGAATGVEVAPAAATPPMLYVPPNRGQARHTAGAGTRGFHPGADAGDARPRVRVLAPADHVGLTARPSPTLYWYLSATTRTRVELTLVDDDAIEPLVQLSLPGPVAAGVHSLALEPLGVALAPGKTYRWFVALVHDAHRRSKDELAEGAIERIESASAPGDRLVAPGRGARAGEGVAALRDASRRYARAGLWYDALSAIESAIEQAPEDPALAADRAALLSQAKLPGELR